VTVVGAGNGGQAAAAHLALDGHRVCLYDRFPEATEAFSESRQLTITGSVAGTAVLRDVTNDIAEATSGAEIILVILPGFALRWFAETIAPFLVDGQVVILHPGGTGGALEVRRVWTESGMESDVTLGETDSLVYACRLTRPGEPSVKAIKRAVAVAALPAERLDAAFLPFSRLYPQAQRAPSVLATGLSNMNAVIHPAVVLLNAGLIDGRKTGFQFYRDGVTPAIARVVRAVDRERMAIAAALAVPHMSCEQWVQSRYGVTGNDLAELFGRLDAVVYQGIGAPESLEGRYISEDVPMGLVPMEAFARLAGVAVPAMSAIISACGLVNDVDYRTEGRTAERLGLDGLARPQEREANTGWFVDDEERRLFAAALAQRGSGPWG
jgi:opine dehydrogenase